MRLHIFAEEGLLGLLDIEEGKTRDIPWSVLIMRQGPRQVRRDRNVEIEPRKIDDELDNIVPAEKPGRADPQASLGKIREIADPILRMFVNITAAYKVVTSHAEKAAAVKTSPAQVATTGTRGRAQNLFGPPLQRFAKMEHLSRLWILSALRIRTQKKPVTPELQKFSRTAGNA
jgi:hypothetical protein